ncbi:LacI family DNA-binding transcriptional regulator [Deinococcus altitudinis]|uniref:LacI family DNA-binding transcriptional regulator n=1 Tax=Deinococcus altitudinis TaxID=468914 RepID=UPI003892BF1B
MTRATLRDVAAHAGVSHQTVSNVLNGHPSIRPTTRERVMVAIRALDYHPNLAAKALRESRVTTLCCAFYGHSAEDISDPYRNLIQSAFIAEAIARGYSITTAFLTESEPESFQRLRGAFLGRQFGGMVMVGPTLPPPWLTEFVRWGMPTVLFDRADDTGVVPSVTAAYTDGMIQVVAHHIAQGRRNLALVLPLSDASSSAILRREGFCAALSDWGLSGRLVEGDWSSESGEAAFHQLWNSTARPDAVVCGNDRMAAGALLAARALGVQVPTEVAISGFDDFEFARYTGPSLTTIHVPHGEMARLAVRTLLARLEAPSSEKASASVSSQMAVTLVIRESA